MELADRMRRANYEQFQTLVRMHLSFELDVNTDENDGALTEKLKPKKRFNFHKKTKSCTSTTSPICTNSHILSREGIVPLQQLMKFLVLEQNIKQEGIFRRTGSLARQNDLRSKINNGLPLNLEEGTYTVHDCASVFKSILADLPEPLLTDTYNVAHIQMAGLCNNLGSCASKETRLIHSLQLLLLLLPNENYILLKGIIEMLHETVKFVSFNKMSASSLATLFTPHLICPKKLTLEALHQTSQQMSGIITFMITKGTDLFGIPPKLATDIRAYFVKEQQKALSPQHVLDESVSSDSTANTVYTFVDKERTAEACVSGNPTDTALAQLYAYIQTLPESSKKRKLIKQFNKENGQGTPLQMLNRLKSSNSTSKPTTKSLGDSIKRHIFQKNIISRSATKNPRSPQSFNTPKRIQTTPKNRQLFQSPYTPQQLQSDKNIKLNSKLTPTYDTNQPSTPRIIPICKVLNESLDKKKHDNSSDGDNDDDVDSFELLSETLNRLQNTSNCSIKKTVAFNVNEESNQENCSPRHVASNNSMNKSDLKSRYKSEPDLSRITENSTSAWNNGRFITNKLLKGVSMVNLKRPFFADRKMLRKSASNLLRKSPAIELDGTPHKELPMIDDEDFEATPNKENSLDWSDDTPHTIDRRSMSPITKSTQRMSKAMQESIMTPRSRKPVMLIGLSLGSSDKQNYQNSFSSLHEEDEESVRTPESQEQRLTSLYRSKSDGNITTLIDEDDCQSNIINQHSSASTSESLTAPFREYLLSRSVEVSADPVDSSFSSQPDDFGSTEDIQNLTESEMSQSLLYCLNGNTPADISLTKSSTDLNVNFQPSRKREIEIKIQSDDAQPPKRMLVIKNVFLEPPGETSL